MWENTALRVFLAAPPGLAGDEQRGKQVLSRPSTLPQGPAPRQRPPLRPPAPLACTAGAQGCAEGRGPAFPQHGGRGCFRAGGQIDFSSAVSTLMHSSAESSITPKTSRGHSPGEGAVGCAGRAWGPPALQAPAGRRWRNTRESWKRQLLAHTGQSNTYSNTAALHSYAVLCSPISWLCK